MKKVFLICSLIMLGTAVVSSNLVYASFEKKTVNKEIIASAKQILNKIKTLKADALQVDKNGRVSHIAVLLDRPHKLMKVSSDTHVVVLKNNKLTSYDKELKEKTELSVYSNPLVFLLDKVIKFEGNVRVVEATEDSDYWFLKCCGLDPDFPQAVLLIFSKKTLTLRGWIIFDNASSMKGISVSLLNEKYGEPLKEEDFKI